MNEPSRARRPFRGTLAVIAGLFFIVVTSTVTDLCLHATGVFPPDGQPMSTGLWALATAYRVVFAVIGCAITARLAPDRPMRHAMILGTIGVLLSTVGTVATWDKGPGFGPHWYPIGLIVTAWPCAWIGGILGGRRSPTG